MRQLNIQAGRWGNVQIPGSRLMSSRAGFRPSWAAAKAFSHFFSWAFRSVVMDDSDMECDPADVVIDMMCGEKRIEGPTGEQSLTSNQRVR